MVTGQMGRPIMRYMFTIEYTDKVTGETCMSVGPTYGSDMGDAIAQIANRNRTMAQIDGMQEVRIKIKPASVPGMHGRRADAVIIDDPMQ